MDLEHEFPVLLEKAIDWASDLESHVLEEGVELVRDQLIDARLAGVKEPARIRLLVQHEMPLPSDELLRSANQQARLLTSDSPGLTLGYGIIIRKGHQHERRLLVHEFVHVGQYERLGGMDKFLHRYLTEMIRDGYENSPLETEARRRTATIVGPATAR